MWDWIKRNWKLVTSFIGGFVGLLFLRQYFQKDLLAKLLNQKTQTKDDILNERKSNISKELVKEQERNSNLQDELNKSAERLSPSEVEDFYKNRK